MPVSPALGRPRKEDHKFEASLGNLAKAYLKKTKKTQTKKKSKFYSINSLINMGTCKMLKLFQRAFAKLNRYQ
jgi:hypothetical protein